MSSDEIIEQHVSPDGLIKLIVFRNHDDISIGLDGFEWHTHADLLAQSAGELEEVAVRNFVDAILENRMVFVISRVAGAVLNIWITDDPDCEWKYKSEHETIELRYWNGALYTCDRKP